MRIGAIDAFYLGYSAEECKRMRRTDTAAIMIQTEMLAFLSVSPEQRRFPPSLPPPRNWRVESYDTPIMIPSLRAIPQTRRVARNDETTRIATRIDDETECARARARVCVMKCNKRGLLMMKYFRRNVAHRKYRVWHSMRIMRTCTPKIRERLL